MYIAVDRPFHVNTSQLSCIDDGGKGTVCILLSYLVVSNLTTSETADPRSLLIFRHFSASDLYLTTAVEDDLKNLIGQAPVSLKIVQN